MNRPEFICFKHCTTFIFCKSVPSHCQVCKSSDPNYTVQPFQVPCPFTIAKEKPTNLVIRPSKGTFFEYSANEDLHIGVVNSSGSILEFDKCGLVKDDFATWNCCIAIKLVPGSWDDHWDEVLEAICQSRKWVVANYNDATLNCFDFVIEFLNTLKFQDFEFLDKERLCRDFILPRIKDVVKYTAIYRKLRDRDYFIQE